MISTKGRYALRVMIDLTEHQTGEYIPLKAIAQRQGISEKYLESILKALVRENLLTGVRGKGGGYRLTRAPETYTVGEILRLTEGSLASVACLETAEKGCERASECLTLPLWQELDRIVEDFLQSVTLQDLLQPGGYQRKSPR